MKHRKQPYDPISFWTEEGKSYHDRFRRTPEFLNQEIALLDVLAPRFPKDRHLEVLEAGCGFGRIAETLFRYYDDLFYVGFDLSPDQLRNARRHVKHPNAGFVQSTIDDYTDGTYDLVLAVEVLMHVKPEDLERTVDKLRSFGPLITCDWTEPVEGSVAQWNFIHDYEALGLKPIRKVGKQTIFSTV